MKRWILFDLDDTLGGVEVEGKIIGTTLGYQHVLKRIGKIVEDFIGTTFEEYYALQTEINVKDHDKHGFADLKVFPTSCITAFEQLEKQTGVKAPEEILRAVAEVAWSVYDQPSRALPGAINVLAVLSKRYKIAIVTKGNDEIQRRKIFDMGLFPYADYISVMPNKSYDEWEHLIHHELRLTMPEVVKSWAVGNSIRCDINPPLFEGFNAIHVESPTWDAYELRELEKLKDTQLFYTVKEVGDVLKLIN